MATTLDDGLTGITLLGDQVFANEFIPTARALLKFCLDNFLFDNASVGRWRYTLDGDIEIDIIINDGVNRIIIFHPPQAIEELPQRAICAIFQEPGYVEWPPRLSSDPGKWHLIEAGREDIPVFGGEAFRGWWGRLIIEFDYPEGDLNREPRVTYGWQQDADLDPDEWPKEGVDSETAIGASRREFAQWTNIEYANGKLKLLHQVKIAQPEIWRTFYAILSFVAPNKAPASWVYRDDNYQYWICFYNQEGTEYTAYELRLSPCGEHLRDQLRYTDTFTDNEFIESYILADAEMPAVTVTDFAIEALESLLRAIANQPGDIRAELISALINQLLLSGDVFIDSSQSFPFEVEFGENTSGFPTGAPIENGIMWNWHGTRGDIVTYQHQFVDPDVPTPIIKWQTMRRYSFEVRGTNTTEDPFILTLTQQEEVDQVTFRVGRDIIWIRQPVDDIQTVWIPVTNPSGYPQMYDTGADGAPVYCFWRRRNPEDTGDEEAGKDPADEELVCLRYRYEYGGNNFDDDEFNNWSDQLIICEWEGVFPFTSIEQWTNFETGGFFERILIGEEPDERELVDEYTVSTEQGQGRWQEAFGSATLDGINPDFEPVTTPWIDWGEEDRACTPELQYCFASEEEPARFHQASGDSTVRINLGPARSRTMDQFLLFPFSTGEATYLYWREQFVYGDYLNSHKITGSANSMVKQIKDGGDFAIQRFKLDGSSFDYVAANVFLTDTTVSSFLTVSLRGHLFGNRYTRFILDDAGIDDPFFDGSFAEFFDPAIFVDPNAFQRFLTQEGKQGETMYTYDLRIQAPDPTYTVSTEKLPMANFNGFWQGHN